MSTVHPSVTCGYYNSLNGDRLYDATQHNEILDGVINDGVYMNIGDKFMISPAGGLSVSIGTGRAWFKNSWTKNNAPVLMDLDQGELLLPRIDAIVLEINGTESVRDNDFIYIKGTPSSNPEKPQLINNDLVTQIPLGYFTMPINTQEITADRIENMVGKTECPFVTGIIQTISTTELITQWEAQWDLWRDTTETNTASLLTMIENELSRLNAGTEVMLKTEYAPDATASIVNNTLEIVSVFTKPLTEYTVQFTMPSGGFTAIKIDGASISGVYDTSGELTEFAPAAGVPVTLVRQNDRAFLMAGGGGSKIVVLNSSGIEVDFAYIRMQE